MKALRPLAAALLAAALPARAKAQAAPAVTGKPAADVWALPPETADSLVKTLPLYAGEKDGSPVVAVNLLFLGEREQIRAALRWAGWYEVGPSIWGDFKKGLEDVAQRRPLEHFPPFSVFYVAGKPQDLNEARATGWTKRHHFRLWDQGRKDPEGREVWAAAGDYDKAVRWLKLDHLAEPEIDRERDFLAATLKGCPFVERLSLHLQPGLPARSFEGHRHFITDRRVLVVELKPGYLPAPVPPGLK